MGDNSSGNVPVGDKSPELDAKDERNVSWRVPNSPKQLHETQVEDNTTKIESPKERIVPISLEKSLTLKFDSNPSSPSESRKTIRITKTASENSNDEPKYNSTNKLWRHLFAGVTRSVDELYVHCEELEDKTKCQEVIDLLKRSRLDFKKLNERIDEQSNFRQGQALSWDIRKPTLPSPNNPQGVQVGHSNPGSQPDSPVPQELLTIPDVDVVGNAAVLEHISDRKSVPVKKLNPEAKPFSPSIFPSPPATAMIAVMDPAVLPLLPPPMGSFGSVVKMSGPISSGQTSRKGNPGKGSVAHPTATGGPGVRTLPPGLVVQGSSRSIFGGDKDGDDWEDERLQAEVLQASEQVWAAAEAWVEAEAAAEEQEWQMLALGIKSYLHQSGALSDYEEEPSEYKSNLSLLGVHSASTSAHNSPKQFPGARLSLGGSVPSDSNAALVGTSADWGGNALLLSPEQRAIWEEQPSPRVGLHRTHSGSAFQTRNRTGSRNNLTALNAPKASGVKKFIGSPHIDVDSPQSFSPGEFSPYATSHRSPGSNRSSSYRSPSQSPTDFGRIGGTPVSGGRSLHDKLSSPERRKARSPSELQRKIEERQIHAEMLRDKSVAERVQKASIASQRIKQAEEREALRIIEKKQVLEDKQLAAQERLQRNLRQIQVRANNETSKVNEVLFNKDLNKEAIAQRLEEAETRILAASTRRQERLQNMTLDQKRRNARKAQQLSEWRLQFDKENMDRWDKLQQRLDNVHARRAARFIELQRRADENAVASEATVTANEKENENVTPSTAKIVSNETPSKVTHVSTEGTRLISALKKGVVSAQKAAKQNPSGKSGSPTGALKASATVDRIAGADVLTQQRSKAKEKREKRKIKAHLIELAQLADYAAIQEAIALNSAITTSPKGASADATNSSESAAATTAFVESSAAEKYVQSLQSFQYCPQECIHDGFAVARAIVVKKINVTAKADLVGLCATDVQRSAPAPDSDLTAGSVLSSEYTDPAAEAGLLAAMQEDIELNGPHLLTLVVKDLLAATVRSSTSASETPSEPVLITLNMHVMQRLFVLLETAPLSASPVKPSRIESTVSEVMLLRLLFGPELGVLKDAIEFQTLLDAIALQHCNRNPHWSGVKEAMSTTLVTQELEVKAEVWKLVFDLLHSCAGTSTGVGLILQSGLAAVLLDVLHALLKCSEALQGAGSVHPTALTFVTTNILQVLAKVVDSVPHRTEEGGVVAKGQCSQATFDAFVWYTFTSAQVPCVVDSFRSAVLRRQETQSYHFVSASRVGGDAGAFFESGDLFVAAAEYLSSICNFVGRSGGLARSSASDPDEKVRVVHSVLQLSPATHRHSKGRQLVSILRRAEALPALLGALAVLADSDFYKPTGTGFTTDHASAAKTALVDNLVVLSRLLGATHSLVCADLSLAQGLTPEQQAQWVKTLLTLLNNFQYTLDGPPQSIFPANYTGRGSLSPIEFSKAHLEHALRRALATLTVTCTQNGPLQRLCGVVPEGSATSLIAQLCSWTPKYFKDKRFKHNVLPCLIALSLDCDANVALLTRLGKLPALLKYLDYSVKTSEVYAQQVARKRTELVSSLTEEAHHMQRLSRLIPADLWSIAIVTLSQRTAST